MAFPLALAVAHHTVRARWIGFWNGLGVLDLIVAVTLGVLSAPGTPFRVFADGPGTSHRNAALDPYSGGLCTNFPHDPLGGCREAPPAKTGDSA